MADVIRFSRSKRTVNRPASPPAAARTPAEQSRLALLRELSEIGMAMARRAAERACKGDLEAIEELARITDEVCQIIELDHNLRNRRPGRSRSKPRTRLT